MHANCLFTICQGKNLFAHSVPYSQVKRRTANDDSAFGSHVMQYGDIALSEESLYLYMGTNPANDNYTFVDDNSLRPSSKAVNQRDADLLHFWYKVIFFF